MTGYAQFAPHYLRAGWSPIPLPHGQKTPVPRGFTGRDGAFASVADIQTWSDEAPDSNIALRLPKHVVGLDFDLYKAAGRESWARMIELYGPLPATWVSTSRSDGSGILLYRTDPARTDDLRDPIGQGKGGFEVIRWSHRYIVAAPSLAPPAPKGSGLHYRWIGPDGQPSKAPRPEQLPELPAAWLEALTPQQRAEHSAATVAATAEGLAAASAYERKAVQGLLDRLHAMTAAATANPSDYRGEPWDGTTFYVACRLFEIANADWSELTPEGVELLLLEHAPRDRGFDDARVRDKVASARRTTEGKPPAAPPTGSRPKVDDSDLFVTHTPAPGAAAQDAVERMPWDDEGNAQRALAAHRGRLLYLTDAETWARWDGERWTTSNEAGARAVQEALRAAPAAERAAWAELDDKKYAKLIEKTRSDRGVVSATNRLRRLGVLDSAITEFDQRSDLLLASNGVVDLRTGALLAPGPEYRLLRGTKVAYDPQAQAPEFDAWLKFAQPDPEIRDYLQLVFGIALTGERVKKYWVHEGVADAGKSMLVRLMSLAIGDMGTSINANLIEGRNHVFGDDYARAALRGARLAVLDETRAGGHSLDTSIKQLVGGAALTARNPYERQFAFVPYFKLHIATNNAPINAPDAAVANRLELVRWDVGSTEEMRRATAARLGLPLDAYLEKHELPGILAWAARGAARFYADAQRLDTPAAVRRATDEHMAEGDLVAQWLRSNTIEAERGSFTSTQGWQDFSNWANTSGERGGPQTQRAWSIEMGRVLDGDPTFRKSKRDGIMTFVGRKLTNLAWHPTE